MKQQPTVVQAINYFQTLMGLILGNPTVHWLQTTGGLSREACNVCPFCCLQNPGGTGSMRAATSLLTGEAMANGSRRKSRSDSTATMRGVILCLATMCLNPKPASHTGTSTLEFPLRGGTKTRTCRRAGGASLPRGTPTTPTSGKGAIRG